MSAIVCGKRSLFEELPTPPISKRIRCSSFSPVRFSPPRQSNQSAIPSTPAFFSQSTFLLEHLRSIFPDMDEQGLNSNCFVGVDHTQTMWASSVSFPGYHANFRAPLLSKSFTNADKRPSLTLKATFFDYHLASRISVRNLPYSTTERRLQDKFSDFGQIAEVKLTKDGITKRSKGYAFIQYTCQDDAVRALENMNHMNFDGRTIYVELAKPGSELHRGYLRTSGPPQEQHLPKPLPEQEEVADCWY